MKNWQPVDFIILILTIGVFLTLAIPMIARAMHPALDISEGGISALTQITIALVSVISVYIGAKVNGKKH